MIILKHFTILLLLFSSILLTSQNVGIGTIDPQTKLHIEGLGHQFMRVHSNNISQFQPAWSGLRLTRNSVTPNNGWNTDWQLLNDGALLFLTAENDFSPLQGAERMRLASTGELGLGVNIPMRKIHASGTGYQAFRIASSDDDSAIELVRNGSDWKLMNDQAY